MLNQVQHDMESYRNIHKSPCHSEFKLGCSHLTAIPSFACKILSCRKSSPASARNPLSESDQHEICLKSKKLQTLKRVQGDMKKVAFTLAETLITIGMIGVIAALTLPTLMNSTNEKEIVAKVKKIRASLSEAHGRAIAKYGPSDTWCSTLPTGLDCYDRFAKRITEFMQVEKECGTGTGCFSSQDIVTPSESVLDPSIDSDNASYKYILSDGTSLSFAGVSLQDSGTDIWVYVDIDGPKKGNNMAGKDLFSFNIVNNRLTTGTPTSSFQITNANDYSLYTYWVLNYDNADYLHVDSSGKCPDGNKLTDSNPTCN